MPRVDLKEQNLGYAGGFYSGICDVPEEALDQWRASGIKFSIVSVSTSEPKAKIEQPPKEENPGVDGIDSHNANYTSTLDAAQSAATEEKEPEKVDKRKRSS